MKKIASYIFRPTPNLVDIREKSDSLFLSHLTVLVALIFGVHDVVGVLARHEYVPLVHGYLLLAAVFIVNRNYSLKLAVYIFLLMFPVVVLFIPVRGPDYVHVLDLFSFPVFISFLLLPIRTAAIYVSAVMGTILALPLIVPHMIPGIPSVYIPLAVNSLAVAVSVLIRFHRDRIEQRRKNEIRENGDLYRRIIENIPDLILRFDKDYRYLYVSPSMERISGLPVSHFIGKKLRETTMPEDVCSFIESTIQIVLKTGEERAIDFDMNIPTRGQVSYSTLGKPERNSEGIIESVLVVARDVTEKRKLESRVKHAEIFERAGKLASQIAHDFNNHLCVIMGVASILDNDIKDPSVKEQVRALHESARSGSELAKQLLSLSRKESPHLMLLDMHEFLSQRSFAFTSVLGAHISVHRDFRASNPVILGDGTRIHDAILNLVVNARDAMPSGGTLTFATADSVMNREEPIGAGVRIEPGDYLAVSIRDTGSGIPKEILDSIFEPFFTTKPKGKGTGLGLATVYGIMQSHRGFVTVESEPGMGSVFTMHFPRF